MSLEEVQGGDLRDLEIVCRPIGVIRTPFKDVDNMPIQAAAATGILGTVEVLPEFAAGLEGLGGFSHIILLYRFHLAAAVSLRVTPFLDSHPQGVFATRAPVRPNALGLSVVRLLAVDGTTLRVENVDMVDGSPLLDIKPYVPEFDVHAADRIGWLKQAPKTLRHAKSDRRFR
jgi:tRNA-Thr(GGU) m(6)t(6)A37 methyltransferase TsaA